MGMKIVPRILLPVSLLCLIATAQAEDIKVGALVFNVSDDWESLASTSSMRAAELKFDVEGDDDPVAVFFYFGPGGAGGAQANIQRWRGQFEGGPTAEEVIDLTDESAVEIDKLTPEELNTKPLMLVLSGTFLDSMAGGGPFAGPKTAKEDYRMLAAIVPNAQGSVFVKLTGPEAAADEVRSAFIDLVKSGLEEVLSRPRRICRSESKERWFPY